MNRVKRVLSEQYLESRLCTSTISDGPLHYRHCWRTIADSLVARMNRVKRVLSEQYLESRLCGLARTREDQIKFARPSSLPSCVAHVGGAHKRVSLSGSHRLHLGLVAFGHVALDRHNILWIVCCEIRRPDVISDL